MSIVNQQQLAELLGYTVQTLIRWEQNEGLPSCLSGQRGRGNEYDTAEVVKWLIQRELAKASGASPRDELDRVRKWEVELRISEKLGKLASAEMMEAAWSSHIEAAKIELLLAPAAIADIIYENHGLEVDEALITPPILQAIKKLTDNADDDTDPDADGDESAGGGVDDEGDD